MKVSFNVNFNVNVPLILYHCLNTKARVCWAKVCKK